ncbi:MAG: PQQ-binding-like beta-propeller repeat protein [Planctomycetota bacterium]
MRAPLATLLIASLVCAGEPTAGAKEAYPAIVGEWGGPHARAFYPVRVSTFERVAWKFTEGAHTGCACPGTDGVLRIQGGGGFIRGVDAASGTRRWIAGGHARFFNYSACVLGPDGTAYGGNHTRFHAVDAQGKTRWTTELGASWIHRPPALAPDGRTVFVGGDALGIAALDTANGRVRWQRRDFGSPWTVYAFDDRGHLFAAFRRRLVCFHATKGKEVWSQRGSFGHLMFAGGRLVAARGSDLVVLDPSTGRELRKTPLGGKLQGLAYSDHGRVLASMEDGRLLSIDTAGRARFAVRVGKRPLGAPVATQGGEAIVVDADGVLHRVAPDGTVAQSFPLPVKPWRWRPTVGPDGSVYVNGKDTVVKVTGPERPPAPPLVAQSMLLVADDFVVDVWVNGKKLPREARELVLEIHGASTERVHADLRPGDWVVFQVANNRLRWGGASYFGARGVRPDGKLAFVSTTKGNWSYCDDPGRAMKFIGNRDIGADQLARKPRREWDGAVGIWKGQIGRGFEGEAIWGKAPVTWLKFIVPRP